MDSMFWNQINLKQPSTSAHQIKSASKNCISTLEKFISFLRKQEPDLTTSLSILSSESIILKQFLYKISAIFRQDKRLKGLKLIFKCLKKLSDMQLNGITTHMIEQHSLGNTIHVSPKSTYEFFLIKFQGAARLLAQILCYCQYSVSRTIERMHQGHHVNISVISVSLISRIWATSLHLLNLLIKQYNETMKIYDSGYLPECSAKFLPENCKLPSNLEGWLQDDAALRDIHGIITSPKEEATPAPEIWDSVKVINEDELDDLMELKELVTKSTTSKSSPSLKRKETLDEFSIPIPVKQVDVGELVQRPDTISLKNKKQRQRKKNRK